MVLFLFHSNQSGNILCIPSNITEPSNLVEAHSNMKNVDIIGIRKIDPRKPNVFIDELTDKKSGSVLIQHFERQLP